MSAVLVDTSCFIEFLRGNDHETLPALILSGRVILSAVVRIELLAGVRKSEHAELDELLAGLAQLKDFPPVQNCQTILTRARGRGLLGGIPDLIILADCERSGARLLSSDSKLVKLAKELKFRVLDLN